MVSTDDAEIAEISKAHGANVPFLRSAASSNDTATTVAVLLEVLDSYEDRGYTFTEACCIYPTSPFVDTDILKEGLALLSVQKFDCVFPVIRYGFPVQRSVGVDDSGRMTLRHPECLNMRSQDLEPTYHDAGMFYWFRPGGVRQEGKLWTENSGCIEVSEVRAQDIDTPTDWELAEFKYTYLHRG